MATVIRWASMIHPFSDIPSIGLEEVNMVIDDSSEYERAKETYEEAKAAFELAIRDLENAAQEVERTREVLTKAREAFIAAVGNDKIEES